MPIYDNKIVFTYSSSVDSFGDTEGRYLYTTHILTVWTYDSERAKSMSTGHMIVRFIGQGHAHPTTKRLIRLPYAFRAEIDMDYLWDDSYKAKSLKKIVNKIVKLGGCNHIKSLIRLLTELKIPRLIRVPNPDNPHRVNDLYIPRPFKQQAEGYIQATKNGLRVMPPNHPFVLKRKVA